MRSPRLHERRCLPASVGTLLTQQRQVEVKQADMPDDVEVTDVSIPATKTMTDHVLYQVLFWAAASA